MIKRRLITLLAATALITLIAGQSFAAETTIRGRLQRTVEPRGWLVVSDTGKYLILNSTQFQNEAWFSVANEVEVTGDTKADVMTSFMEGTPFEARTMRSLSGVHQNATSVALTKVIVSGDSIVQAQPDTAILTIAVVSQSKRALDAQQENATKSDATVRALKAAAGSGAEVKTSGYSLQPMRVYKEGVPPTITGYEARNSVTIIMSDLTKVGSVIDAASQAGANDVAGLSFTLRKDRPARDQALADATREAVGKATVIAQALGGRVVRIIEVQEEGTNRPRPVYETEQLQYARAGAVAPTPIEVGTLDITSRVQLIAEIETSR